MNTISIENKTFQGCDFTNGGLLNGDYEKCIFRACDFSSFDLSQIRFVDCEFVRCNLSLVGLQKAVFRDIQFKESKMLGLHFENCIQIGLSFSFDNCNLSHSSFFKTKLHKTIFRQSQLHEVDFSECDLTSSLFDLCDLAGATFKHTIIEKSDFRTSFKYTIDPEINRLKKAKFSLPGALGLLARYGIEID
jgi:fluoroquinolone resistance protein